MNKIELSNISKQSILNGEFNIEEFHHEIEEKRNEKILQMSKSLPNLIAEIPEKKMLIILIDIVGFSKSSTRQQVYDIYLFQRFLISQILCSKITDKFDFEKHIHISNFIPTGDGCYIVAEECEPEAALNFLITLLKGYNFIQQDEIYPRTLRISAEIGYCVPFIDIAKHKNYIGEGMNEAARILSYGQKVLEEKFMKENSECSIEQIKAFSRNTLYLSDCFAPYIQEYQNNCKNIYNFFDVEDKHGKKRNVNVMQGIQ